MLLTSLAAVAIAQSASDEVRLVRYPAIHGDKYVFVYASDLWLGNLDGGPARRLTSHPGLEQRPHFSPDGSKIVFTGQYDGPNNAYVIPTEGGEPKRLTYEPLSTYAMAWTPDGKVAYSSTYGSHTNRMARLWMVSPEGGLPMRTDLQECQQLSFSPDGSTIAFTRVNSHQFNWRRYGGGTQGRISFWNLKTNEYSEIPSGREQSYFPMWVEDQVFFISSKNQQTLNLYAYNTKSKRVEQLTKFSDADIRWPSTDGKKIIFERNLKLYTYDIASKAIDQVKPRVMGDNLSMRPRYRNLSQNIDGAAISPSGKRIIAEGRGELFSVPAKRGITRNLTETDGAREQLAEWSPDGQYIYYLSDESGEQKITRQPQMGGKKEVIKTPSNHILTGFVLPRKGDYIAYATTDFSVYVLNTKTGQSTKVHQDIGQPPSYEFSPDGNWVGVTVTNKNFLGSVALYDIKNDKLTQVTDSFFGDTTFSFDQSGKYLYVVSGRTYGANPGSTDITLHQENLQRVYVVTLQEGLGNPLQLPDDEEPIKKADAPKADPTAAPAQEDKPMKVDLDGIKKRMVALPYPPASYPIIAGVNNGVLVWTLNNATLNLFSMTSKQNAPIIGPVNGIALNPARTKLGYQSGNTFGIIDIRPGQQVGAGRVSFNNMGFTPDPEAEYEQMFWDVWRFQRDQFYDVDMLGLDWDAIGKKYAAMLPYIGDRSDFDYIIGQLIGELGTGHAYVTAGPTGSDPMTPPAGLLGADYKAVGNKVVFNKIYRGDNAAPAASGPLGKLGVDVKEGEYLLAINGEEVTTQTGVSKHLVGKIGQKVVLTVNSSPSMSGARKVEVVPASSETQLRYETWVEERRAMVDKMSGGRIGYFHVPDTNVAGMINFVKGYFGTLDKEAWVIDERYNGGGWIPTFFTEQLSREFNNFFAPRHGVDVGLPTSLMGPKAMLVNGYAGSGGDLFPYLFKKAGLGPLIGTRTWGGLVGIQGSYSLIGGGAVTSPGFGIYDPQTGKWIAENTGVDPDIEVDDRPDLAAKGEDPQLARAVKYLLDELKKPQFKPKKPEHPVVDK